MMQAPVTGVGGLQMRSNASRSGRSLRVNCNSKPAADKLSEGGRYLGCTNSKKTQRKEDAALVRILERTNKQRMA